MKCVECGDDVTHAGGGYTQHGGICAGCKLERDEEIMKRITSKAVWTQLRDNAPPFARLNRVENNVGFGIPDVNGCFLGNEFWIEIKIGTIRRDPEQPIFDKKYGMTVEQINWHIEQNQAGGRSFILLRIGENLFLVEGHKASRVNQWTLDALVEESLIWSALPVEAGFWPRFWAILAPRRSRRVST